MAAAPVAVSDAVRASVKLAVAQQVAGVQWANGADLSAAPPNTLWFYSNHTDTTGCFSNFSAHPVYAKGSKWQTSEHYFQAMKFEHSPADVAAVAGARGPMQAARMGRDRARPLRKDWERVKDDVMFDAVVAKFRHHHQLGATLLGTGDQVLVEHTGNDSYWGDAGDGSGKNTLGQTLMMAREVLRLESAGAL
jgi:ribA/ribD-fused uncharacterized protein